MPQHTVTGASLATRWQRHTSANGLGCLEDALRRERVIAIESQWGHHRGYTREQQRG
jgi:hypothetical protein